MPRTPLSKSEEGLTLSVMVDLLRDGLSHCGTSTHQHLQGMHGRTSTISLVSIVEEIVLKPCEVVYVGR